MSQENVETLRRGIDAINRGEIDALAAVDEIADPDVELRSVGRLPDVNRVRGREAVKSWFTEILGTFEFRIEPEEFFDAGDAVVVVARHLARGRASGAETKNRFALVFGFQNGKVTYFDTYPSKAEALEAVGLRE